jgi:hypothetical protein
VTGRKIGWTAGFALIALGFAYYAAGHPMDFRVYYYGARGVFSGTRPVYGLTSGLGWPMHYRYPPLFLLLFAPLARLPLAWGAAIWVVLKIALLERGLKPATTYLAQHADKPVVAGFSPRSFIFPLLFTLPYLIEEFRYGNAQFFVFALSAVALLLERKRPVLGAASLALGISIKVWPLFFVPYLAVRRNWKMAGCTLAFAAVLTMLPGFYFGFGENASLLKEWYAQEMRTQLGESEIWFPNQSLRGVLMRYLTFVDYSKVPDSNYAEVNVVTLDPAIVRSIWLLLAVTVYAGFLWLANRRRKTDASLDHGLAFCLIAVLEPFTQKYALAILLWPALAASGLVSKRGYRTLLYSATILVLIQPLTPGAGAQRFLQVLGLDFAAATLLTAALAAACWQSRKAEPVI